MVVSVDGVVPDPADFADPDEREAAERALRYMALEPGTALTDIAIDRVFIGSCTNARIEDLRAAAEVVSGRRVADGVHAIVVPGSATVKRQAEAEGLREVFEGAGFEWRRAGCSMCLGMNPDILAAGRALRVDVEPQLRRPPRCGGPDAPAQPGDGRGRRREGPVRRRAGVCMRPLPSVTGSAAVLDRADVDTDQIIPKQFLKRIERSGYGEFLFFDWMKDESFELHRRIPARRSCSPAATSGADRRASTPRGRSRTTASTWCSHRRSATSSARTPSTRVSLRSSSRRPISRACATRSRCGTS